MAVVTRIPRTEVGGDGHIADTRLFRELPQRSESRTLSRLDSPLDELAARLGMLECKNLLQRRITKHHGAGLVCKAHEVFSLIFFHLTSFSAKGMPACAGLVDGIDT